MPSELRVASLLRRNRFIQGIRQIRLVMPPLEMMIWLPQSRITGGPRLPSPPLSTKKGPVGFVCPGTVSVRHFASRTGLVRLRTDLRLFGGWTALRVLCSRTGLSFNPPAGAETVKKPVMGRYPSCSGVTGLIIYYTPFRPEESIRSLCCLTLGLDDLDTQVRLSDR